MATDATEITLDVPVDASTTFTDTMLNMNVRDALLLTMFPPTCIVFRSAVQTLGVGGAFATISFDSQIVDSQPVGDMWDIGTPTKVFCRTPGWYEVSGECGATALVSGNAFFIAYQVNGGAIYGGDASVRFGTGNSGNRYTTLIKLTNATDYIEMIVKTTQAGAPSTCSFAAGPWLCPRMEVRRVRGI